MAVDYDDNNNNNHMHHLRRDVHEAHTSAQLAKLLGTLALIASAVALALSLWAMDKAGQAQSDANHAVQTAEQSQ